MTLSERPREVLAEKAINNHVPMENTLIRALRRLKQQKKCISPLAKPAARGTRGKIAPQGQRSEKLEWRSHAFLAFSEPDKGGFKKLKKSELARALFLPT